MSCLRNWNTFKLKAFYKGVLDFCEILVWLSNTQSLCSVVIHVPLERNDDLIYNDHSKNCLVLSRSIKVMTLIGAVCNDGNYPWHTQNSG